MKLAEERKRIDIEPLLEQFATVFTETLQPSRSTIQLIGIHRGGVWLARWVQQQLQLQQPIGELDISFYRDDFNARGLQPQVRPSKVPCVVDGMDIVLVDDVILSGRTVRAALNEIFDYGRPKTVRLACLIDLGRHELPIRPDVCASHMQLADNQRIELVGPEPLQLFQTCHKESSTS